MTRTFAALFSILGVLSACSNQENSGLEEITAVLRPNSKQPLARAVALQQTGAPLMQVSFLETELTGALVLESRRDGVDTWLSADGATLIMERGMLRGTRGLGEGLMATDISGSLDMVFSHREGFAERFHSYLNGNDEIVTRSYLCEFENRGARTVKLGGADVSATLMAETCRSLDQEFLNLYWLRASDNQIIQSRQWTGDFLGVLTTRVVPS